MLAGDSTKYLCSKGEDTALAFDSYNEFHAALRAIVPASWHSDFDLSERRYLAVQSEETIGNQLKTGIVVSLTIMPGPPGTKKIVLEVYAPRVATIPN